MKLFSKWQKYIRGICLLGALLLLGIGGAIAYFGNSQGSPLLILVGFGSMAGGVLLFLSWKNMREARVKKTKGKEGEEEKPPNSLNIYPKLVAFEYVESPLGQEQKCYNDGKYYYVYIKDHDPDKLKEFELPDDDENERYYCPREFANPITMLSNKKYFTWSATTMQKISVAVLGIIIAAEIIGLIAMGG